MPASAFFPRTVNHFIEYRPIADEAGRLLIEPFEGSWATLLIPAAGLDGTGLGIHRIPAA
jgi:hypothetical protein